MFGLKPMEMIFIVGVLVVMASAVIGVVYIGVRLALRYDRENSNRSTTKH